jgi:putative pyruvate formate lyase activating enzyme
MNGYMATSTSAGAGMNLYTKENAHVLKTDSIRKALPRYTGIILDDLPANYMIAKRIMFTPERSMSKEDMWDEHGKLMQKFRTAQWMIDEGKLDLAEVEKPRFSLLDLKVMLAEETMKSCGLCERGCGVDRVGYSSGREAAFRAIDPGHAKKGQADYKGACGVGRADTLNISFEGVHYGEEKHVSPSHAVFFMGCNMGCAFCQNHEISQWKAEGRAVQPKAMAAAIKHRHDVEGARNVNWVGGEPTPQTLGVLMTLRESDVNTPQIWNSNFYMSEIALRLLDGVVDMYLPDFKFGNDTCARHIGKVERYMEVVTRNHIIASGQGEMTIRHLVLPGHLDCCTKPALEWIADNLEGKAVVNVMGQYEPSYKALGHTDLQRRVGKDEMAEAMALAKKLKLNCVS